MVQETGETRDAIMEADQKVIEQILNANKDRQDPYWIVMFAKPAQVSVDGKFTLVKHIKPYGTKPAPQVGMITCEVNNKTGELKWDVNMPQAPLDYDMLKGIGATESDDVVIETTSIPDAYITK